MVVGGGGEGGGGGGGGGVLANRLLFLAVARERDPLCSHVNGFDDNRKSKSNMGRVFSIPIGGTLVEHRSNGNRCFSHGSGGNPVRD